MSSANWPPANDDERARLLAELVRRDAHSPSNDLSGDEESTIRDLEAKLDTLVGTLREPPPLDDFAEESDCRRATELAKSLVKKMGPEEMPLNRAGPYQVVSKLGQGGMGSVYKAVHDKLKRVVAIKVLSAGRPKSAETIARFEREMEAIGALHHPNIVAARDAAEVDGMQYLVMEYIDGIDLSTLSRKLGPLAVPDACEIIRQAAVGLYEAHRMGMVHRDMKPSNLMLATAKSDGGCTVKILDFGLALLAAEGTSHSELTATDQIMGTLNYMAPEQGSGSHTVDARADVYSLGATLYRLLSGQPPFADKGDGSPWALITALATEEPTPLSTFRADLSPKLVSLVSRMMAKDPAERFASAADVAEALAPWGRGADLAALLLSTEDAACANTSHSVTPVFLAAQTSNSVGEDTRYRTAWWTGAVLLLIAAIIAWSLTPSSVESSISRSRETAEWLLPRASEIRVMNATSDLVTLEQGDQLPGDFRQLVLAFIDNNQEFTNEDLARFDGLPLFTTLSAGWTRIDDDGLRNLGELPRLQMLFLPGTAVTDAGLEQLRRYPKLEVLHLYDTEVTDAGLAHLAGHAQLFDLALGACDVSDAGLKHLTGLKRLQILSVNRTRVTPVGIVTLQASLPNCEIRSDYSPEELAEAAKALREESERSEAK